MSFVLGASLALGGCLLVTPLDDFEKAPPASAGKGSGGNGGAAGESAGGNPNGDAGTPGSLAGEGGAPSAGEGGKDGGEGAAAAVGNAGNAGAAGAPECRTNAECIKDAGGPAARCRPDGRCVLLKSGECPLAFGEMENDDAIYIGSFAPLPDDVPESSTVVQAELLALEDFSGSIEQGLPGANGKRHPLVVVFCDSSTREQVLGGMAHLANQVQVPAVLSMLKPADMLEVHQEFASRELFYLNPVGATNNVATLEDDGLVWNLLGQPSDLVPVYLDLVRALEAHVRIQRGFAAEDRLKVALVTTTDAFNLELANLVGEDLEINGDPARDDLDNYRLFTVRLDDPESPDTPTTIGDRVREFQPDLVISAANEAFTRNGVLEAIEVHWRNDHGDAPRPHYVLSPYNAGDMDAVLALVGAVMGINGVVTDANANVRFVGIEAAGALDRRLQNAYASRLRGSFPNAGTDSGNYYDAFYFLAYAMYHAGAGPDLTGPKIQAAFRHLLGGPKFDVGPNPIPDVFEALAPSSASIELIGTLGPPDFNSTQGIRVDSGSVFCIQRNGDVLNKVVDALRYDRDDNEFEGEFPCFEGFPPPL